MKSPNRYRKLLAELSRDPRLKRIIAKTRRGQRYNNGKNVETATSMFVLVSTIASRLSKKKRARTIEQLTDIVQLLVQVSLLLKENVFDRPEVKKFFRRCSRQTYLFAQEWLAWVLPRNIGADRLQPNRKRS